MPYDVVNPMASFIGYLQSERNRIREQEDAEIDKKIALVHDLITGPGANPARTAQGYQDIMDLYAAKGGRWKRKGGVGGFLGETEIPLPTILAGLTHGDFPFQGPTHEHIQQPGFENQATDVGIKGPLPGVQQVQPHFDGKSVLDEPIQLPPPPIQAAPSGNRMLDAARQMEVTRQLPMAQQPVRRAPEEVAEEEGRAAGIKAGETAYAQKGATVRMLRDLGMNDQEIADTIKMQMMGSRAGLNTEEGGYYEIPNVDGTKRRVHAIRIEDRMGGWQTVDEATRLPIPPNAVPVSLTEQPNPDLKLGDVIRQMNSERQAKGLPPLTAQEVLAIQDKWQQNGRPVVNNILRNDKGLSGNQQFAAATKLQGQWNKESKAYSTMINQLNLMQEGLKQAEGGNLNSGSQAILVTFQKILDPNSVVRESEYARSPEGLGLMNRMEGALDRLRYGGAGIPLTELQGFVRTGQAFVSGLKNSLSSARGQIDAAAALAGIDPKVIYGNETGLPEVNTPAQSISDQQILDYFRGK